MDILGEIKDLAEKNPDQARAVVDKAEEIVDEQTGHKFTGQIGQGKNALEGQFGLEQQPADGQAQ